MNEAVKRILGKFRELVETYGARALLTSLLVIAFACSGAVSTLMRLDGKLTATACASMAFYGFCFGWLCKWIEVEKVPLCKMRRTIGGLPHDQRAVLFAAHAKRGAFDRTRDFSESRAGNDLLALESLGIVVRIKDSAKPSWMLSKDARKLLDNNARLLASIEADYASWTEDIKAKEHERLVDAAKQDLYKLDRFGASVIVDLLEADRAAKVDEDGMDTIARHIGDRLLNVRRTRDGMFSVKASAIAREAAPLVFADMVHDESDQKR